MEWLFLLAAGLLEVTWAVAMKFSQGFRLLVPSVVTAVAYLLSAFFLSLALRKLPLGTSYALWTGGGMVGTVVLGALLFGEKLSLAQCLCVVVILGGIVALRLVSK